MSKFGALLLHPKTKKQAEFFLKKPVSPLLILGQGGSGKRKLAFLIGTAVLDLGSEKNLSDYPYFFHAKKPANKQEISIDTVREITRFVKLKTPGNQGTRRLILIEDAQYLSLEAQNALLKILEEPNDDSLFLLTAPSELSLLPTIISRCRHIWAYQVTLEQAGDFYTGKFGSKKLESAWSLSQGSSGLLQALLEEDTHPLRQVIEQAKLFLSQPRNERILTLDALAKRKDDLRFFLEALTKILAALHRGSVNQSRPSQAQRLLEDRKLVQSSIEALDKNANSKLVCISLALNLKS